MPAHHTRVPDRPLPGSRAIAGILLVLVTAVPVVSLVEARAALKDWPYVPVRFTGDDIHAALETVERDGTTDSAFVGLAARTASPPTGPAALVLPIDDDTLHEPLQYRDRILPWINQRLLDDMLALKVDRADYDSAIAPSLVDDLLAKGTVVPFSDTVLAPPPGTVTSDERIIVYYLERDDVFVLVPNPAIEVD
ncbi:MAG: hypothetical protein RBS17_04900, partial [Coriobacteriia bacterium]|nr:hypothetical protein [Coriobacteriia bacterium]